MQECKRTHTHTHGGARTFALSDIERLAQLGEVVVDGDLLHAAPVRSQTLVQRNGYLGRENNKLRHVKVGRER